MCSLSSTIRHTNTYQPLCLTDPLPKLSDASPFTHQNRSSYIPRSPSNNFSLLRHSPSQRSLLSPHLPHLLDPRLPFPSPILYHRLRYFLPPQIRCLLQVTYHEPQQTRLAHPSLLHFRRWIYRHELGRYLSVPATAPCSFLGYATFLFGWYAWWSVGLCGEERCEG